MHSPGSVIEIGIAIFAVRFIAGEAVFEHASRRGDVLVFRPVLGLRLLIGFAIVGIPFAILEAAPGPHDALWEGLLLAIMIGMYAAIPGTILVDRNSIRETRWFGLRRIRIPWNKVSYAGNDADNCVTVRSKDDRIIQHTQYNVDRAGFIAALKEYCENCSYNYPQPKPWVPL